MRGKDYNTGLRGVLFEQRHYARMGAALWLYGWLVLRQTHQQGSVGWVLGGTPISYREIEEETGFNSRTLERWMRTLRTHGYVETEAAPGGVIVRITKAKKFTRVSPDARKAADGVRRVAGEGAQNRVASDRQRLSNQWTPRRISSSSVEKSIQKQRQGEIHRDFHSPAEILRNVQLQPHNSSFLDQKRDAKPHPQQPSAAFQQRSDNERQQKFLLEARLQQQLLRAEREESVRRELAVGTGPEV